MSFDATKYMDAHKRWISQANQLMVNVQDFDPTFVRSLASQVESGKPLTAKQFVSLKKIVGLLKFKAKPQDNPQLELKF
jgi:hypothetical protein